MASLFISLILIAIAVYFVIYCIRKKRTEQQFNSGEQLTNVQTLLKDLEYQRFELILPGREDVGRFHLTLKEAALLIDDHTELSDEKFDEDKILFYHNDTQLFALEPYFKKGYLPEPIHMELKDFYNSHYKSVNAEDQSFFVITPSRTTSDKLFEGNGEAFESWLSFKESAHNLFYLIHHWLKENA